MHFLKVSFFVFLAFSAGAFLSSCQIQPEKQANEAVRFTILHTNDHHGRFWHNKAGEYGMAARKTLIDEIREELAAEGIPSLLLSGGDINTGVPESDTLDAEPDFKGMALLGYDAMAVGNHEFDNSLETIRKQESWVQFPFLAANIYEETSNQRLFKPYKVFEFNGLRIGVIGLITHETAYIGNRKFVKGLRFAMPEDETKALLKEVKAQSDVTLALTHMGHSYIDRGTDISLAKSVDGLDMIIGGHSAEAVCVDKQGALVKDYQAGDECRPDKVNGTWIMQAEEWGRYLGRADFIYDEDGLRLESYKLIPINLRNAEGKLVGDYIPPNKTALKLLSPFQEAGRAALTEIVGHSSVHFERYSDEYLPNAFPLGKLLTRAMIYATGADLAFYNSGGIRSDLAKGDIRVRDILTLQPFHNTIVLKTFKGSELLDYLNSIELLPKNKKEMQFSGMFVNENNKVLLSETEAEIDIHKDYVVALNDFMAHGGDGYPAINKNGNFSDTGLLDYQILIEYIKENSPLNP